LGASPAPALRLAPGTGLSAPIFWLRYPLRQKYFRFYPLRGAKMASMPFLRFTFLLRKNVGIRTAGIYAAASLPARVARNYDAGYPCRFCVLRFCSTKTQHLYSRHLCRPAALRNGVRYIPTEPGGGPGANGGHLTAALRPPARGDWNDPVGAKRAWPPFALRLTCQKQPFLHFI
jgi:hypothetical protein